MERIGTVLLVTEDMDVKTEPVKVAHVDRVTEEKIDHHNSYTARTSYEDSGWMSNEL